MNEITPYTITLITGYTPKDKRGEPIKDKKTGEIIVHREVTFGKRINGKTLFAIDSDPTTAHQTLFSDGLQRHKITKFGELKMPVAANVLLSLDSIDREDLSAAEIVFMAQSLKDLTGDEVFDDSDELESGEKNETELIDGNKLMLKIGWSSNGLIYDVCTFGRKITGHTEVLADRLKFKGIKRVCFFAAQQITQLSQSNGESVLDFPNGLEMEIIEDLDLIDVYAIRAASEVWRTSFRFSRKDL